MRLVLAVLLLPLIALAQESFDPVRLDDGQGTNYFYPRLQWEGGSLFCAWSSVLPDTNDGFVRTEGVYATPGGELLNRETFQEVEFGRVYCPGELSRLYASDGSHPFLIYHS